MAKGAALKEWRDSPSGQESMRRARLREDELDRVRSIDRQRIYVALIRFCMDKWPYSGPEDFYCSRGM